MSDTTEEAMPTDDVLVGKITRRGSSPDRWEGAARAFEELYRRHADRLLLFLSARLADGDVNAVHQAVWMEVWRLGAPTAKDEDFRTLLLEIAGDEIADRSAVESNDEAEDKSGLTLEAAADPDAAIVDRQRMQIVAECFAKLESNVAAVVRRRLAGESSESVGAELGIDPSVAVEMFVRGKALLSVYLKRAGSRST